MFLLRALFLSVLVSGVCARPVSSPPLVGSAGVEDYREVDEAILNGAQKAHASVQRALDLDDTSYETLNIGQSFKVLQIADMHLSTFQNGRVCHSPKPGHETSCSDDDTIDFVKRLLDEEKPDLVVFSGDNVNGETTADAGAVIRRYASTCIERNIKWIHIFGNHDDEHNISQTVMADRLNLFELGKDLPLSLTHKGPKGVNGIGNGYLTLERKGKVAGRVWYLDSGSYIPGGKYGFIHRDQVDWYSSESDRLAPSPVDITFFHIPTSDWNDVEHKIGEKNEPVMEQGKPSTILKAMGAKVGLQVASTGHDHTNDYCGLNRNVNLCYGGGIGYGRAYGSEAPAPYFDKRARVFRLSVLSDTETRLETWKRLDDDALTVVDVQTLGIGSTDVEATLAWQGSH